MKVYDALIVGAGAAGLLLGRELEKKGISYIILEEDKYVGNPLCTGLVSIDGARELDIYFEEAIENEIYGFEVYSKNERICFSGEEPKGIVYNRVLFDRILYKEISENVLTRTKAIGIKRIGKDLIKILTNNGTYLTRIIIGCDGINSIVAKSFGLDKEYEIIEISKTYVKDLEFDKNIAHLFISKDISREFFAWVLYRKNRYEVAIGSYKYSEDCLRKFMKKLGINSSRIYKSYIPLDLSKEYCFDNGFLLGNSAGQVKSSTGGGIIYSGYAARIAGDAIVKALDEENFTKDFFDREYKQRFEKEYKFEINTHKFLRKIFLKANDKDLDEVIRISKELNLEELIMKYSNTDKPYKFIRDIVSSKKFFKLFLKLLKIYIKI